MMLWLALLAQAGLPDYAPEGPLEGKLTSLGSDTLNNLMTYWAEALKNAHPGLDIQIEGNGGMTAPTALIAGVADLGPLARPFREKEVEAFTAKYGYPPTEFKVAWDGLAVFVHKDNPIPSLSLEQVDAIFSKTGRRKGVAVATWGDLGLAGDWASRPITLHGRNSASGSYGFFKERALLNGDFKDAVKEQRGSASLVLACSTDLQAIGYSGIGYKTPGVRAVPLVVDGRPVEPTEETIRSETYPISRPLRLYVNRDPAKPCHPRVREFLRLVYSKQGQDIVVKDGYHPLSPAQGLEERRKLD